MVLKKLDLDRISIGIDSDPREEDRREQTFRRTDDFESRHGRHRSRSR